MNKSFLKCLDLETIGEWFKAYSTLYALQVDSGFDKEAVVTNKKILQLLPYLPTTIQSAHDYGQFMSYQHDLTKLEVMAPMAFKAYDDPIYRYDHTGLFSIKGTTYVALPWKLSKEDQEKYDTLQSQCEEQFNKVRSGEFITESEQAKIDKEEKEWYKLLKAHSNLFLQFQIKKYLNESFKIPPRFFWKKKKIYEVAELLRTGLKHEIKEGRTDQELVPFLEQFKPVAIPLLRTLTSLNGKKELGAYTQIQSDKKELGLQTRFNFAHFLTEGQIAVAIRDKTFRKEYNNIYTHKFIDRLQYTLKDETPHFSWNLIYKHNAVIEFLAYQEACEQLYKEIICVPYLKEFFEVTGIVKPKKEDNQNNEQTINNT